MFNCLIHEMKYFLGTRELDDIILNYCPKKAKEEKTAKKLLLLHGKIIAIIIVAYRKNSLFCKQDNCTMNVELRVHKNVPKKYFIRIYTLIKGSL